ncbi:alpha/beta fold hydrolase [Candidatus Woesearchaeota archaeon]|nr:alpha/beta fold hydrolase [Candidatus Woesearchaeota archaeon]
MKKRVLFKNSNGQNLVGVLYIPMIGSKRLPCTIVCPGFLANKDWKFIPLLAEKLCTARFVVLCFDFTGNGESQGSLMQGTYSQKLLDLNAAINFMETVSYIDKKRIAVVGHSMGGAIAAIAASHDNRIKAAVLIATPAYTGKFEERDVKFIREASECLPKHGKVTVTTPDGSMHEITKEFIDDAMKQNVLSAAKKVTVPVLVVHGELDKTVPLGEGTEIFASLASEKKEFHVIKGAKHNFAKPEFEKELSDGLVNFLKSVLV